MKTLPEIIDYLSDKCCKDETDAIAIQKIVEDTCDQKVSINFHSSEYKPITFVEFKKWLTDFSPKVGDILYYKINSTFKTFIVKEVFYGGYKTLASYSSGKKLITTEELIEANNYIRYATPGERLSLIKRLKEKNLVWSKEFNIILKPIEPHTGTYARFLCADKQGICIFDKVSKKGDAICFAILDNDGNLEYQYPAVLKNFRSIIFYEAVAYDRERLKLKLEEGNKRFDYKFYRIDDLSAKLEKGITYHYLDDTFNINTVISKSGKKDADRYASGNYMLDFDDIVELQDAIHSKIKEIKSRGLYNKNSIQN